MFVIIFFLEYVDFGLMQKSQRDSVFLSEIVFCVKKIRQQKNVTLEAFYFDTGIHLARIEQGKQNISIITLSRICDYFNISLSDFFKMIEERN